MRILIRPEDCERIQINRERWPDSEGKTALFVSLGSVMFRFDREEDAVELAKKILASVPITITVTHPVQRET